MRAIKTTTISILALGLLAGSAVGVVAQEEDAGATSFTGTGHGGPVVEVETTETVLPNGFTAVDGFTYRNEWESSDERLTGDVTGVNNHVVGPSSASGAGGLPNMVMSLAIEVTNDGGSWLGEGTGFASSDLGVANEMYTLVGQGGYEGLTAYVIIESTGREAALSGIVFPAPMPEVPEPYAE